MTKEDLLAIKLYSDFIRLRDSLNMTDMQREIFQLRFQKQNSVVHICMALHISKSKYHREMKHILSKISDLDIDELLKRP